MKNASVPKLDLKQLLLSAQLPGLPQNAARLLDLSQDPNNGPTELAVPIEVDPGLTGQVLKFVNSSFFSFARRISSVKMAINLVGIRTIKNFVLWNAVFSLMKGARCGSFNLNSLWQDSLRRALFARALAKLLGIKDAEDIFAAALLQDMAIPILVKASPTLYAKLLDSRDKERIRLSILENRALGWTHGQAAGVIARHWNFPEEISYLIENHIAINKCLDNPAKSPDLVAIAMSAILPATVDPVWMECQQFEMYYNKFVPSNKPTILDLLTQIDEEYDRFAPFMTISTPPKSMAESYNEVTASAQ